MEGQTPPPRPPADLPPPPAPGELPPPGGAGLAPRGPYPVSLEVLGGVGPRNRLTVFFRIILAIPWLILTAIYGIALIVLFVIAWLGVIILGRHPETIHRWLSGILRFSARFGAFMFLLTDAWPQVGWGEEPDHPVKVAIAPRAESQSRLKALFRIVLMIPLFVISYGINWMIQGGIVASWLTIVFRGYQPQWLESALTAVLAWEVRYNAYFLLLTDVYPPVGEDAPKLAVVA
jgi:uncharacterized protein DUF4389